MKLNTYPIVLLLMLMSTSLLFVSSCKKDDVVKDSDSFTDARDGIVYKTIKIGKQVWMAENLRYLPVVVASGTGSKTEAYYYVYGYDGTDVAAAKATDNYKTYGVLYNWKASVDACPTGWHLPEDSEWTVLADTLGGLSVAGGKLKETGLLHWNSPNTGASNETGFTALAGGYRYYSGTFNDFANNGYFWTATEAGTDAAWYRGLYSSDSRTGRYSDAKEYGFSVRCVKN
jgi:uncharacterized protein (TIGR02145 family)